MSDRQPGQQALIDNRRGSAILCAKLAARGTTDEMAALIKRKLAP